MGTRGYGGINFSLPRRKKVALKAFDMLPGSRVPMAVAGVAVLILYFPLAAQDPSSRAGSRQGTVEVRGVVQHHATGEPLANAAVSLAAGPGGTPGQGTRISNDQGRFLFRNVPAGTYRLTVTLLSYHSLTDTLSVPEDQSVDLVLPLSTDPIPLEPIVVEADRERWTTVGYQGRDRAGSGPYLLTREEISRRQPVRLTDVIAGVPGARVIRRAGLGSIVRLRSDCTPAVVVDGVRLPHDQGIDQLVRPGDAESIRVYHGAELPVQYGLNQCGGVVIETRRGGPPGEGEEPKGGIWRYVVGLGLTLLTVFAIR